MTVIGLAAPTGTLSETACMEQMQRAYVAAVAAAARCVTATPNPDYEGVDLEIHQTADHTKYSQARVDLQLKATKQTDVVKDDHIAFRLDKDHYDALRDTRVYQPRILVVMLLPEHDPEGWIYQHHRAMLLRKSSYWVSLRGAAEITTASKTVHVPLGQPFTVSQLLAMLQRIGNGGEP